MFGYVTADPRTLSDAQKAYYRGLYCGVCRSLRKRHGLLAPLTLSYDLVFPVLVLLSVYGDTPQEKSCRCVPHPLEKHLYYSHPVIDYAADMDLALMYYKFMDDWQDDRNPFRLAEAKLVRKAVLRIEKEHPRVCGRIRECLEILSDMEKRNETDPDRTSACFGALMGEIFVWHEQDPLSGALWETGSRLGQFVYLCDAALDLKKDLKKKRFNPLVSQPARDWRPVLEMMMADCVLACHSLPLKNNASLIDNILYSGVWTRWETAQVRRRRQGKTSPAASVPSPEKQKQPEEGGPQRRK